MTQDTRQLEMNRVVSIARNDHWNQWLASCTKTGYNPMITSSVITYNLADACEHTIFISIIAPGDNPCNETGKTIQAAMSFSSLDSAEDFAKQLLAQAQRAREQEKM